MVSERNDVVTFRKERAGFGNRNLPGCSFLISSEASDRGPRTTGEFPPLVFTPRGFASQILRIIKISPVFHILHWILVCLIYIFLKDNISGAGSTSSATERTGKQGKCAFGL